MAAILIMCTWTTHFPTLNTGRSESSIEKLSVSNPSSWSVLSGTLPTNGAHRGTRAVYYDDAIYVLGGCYESRTYWDVVHKIDVLTGAVTQQTDMTLPNEMGWTACSVVSNSIWCAGGRTAGGYLDTIIKYTFRPHLQQWYQLQLQLEIRLRLQQRYQLLVQQVTQRKIQLSLPRIIRRPFQREIQSLLQLGYQQVSRCKWAQCPHRYTLSTYT